MLIKALKKSLLAALLSFSLLLMFSPVEAFAGQPWTQSCNHGDIGTTASTMYAMGRVTTGYDTWMGTGNYYLGKYNWTKVEQ